MFLALSAGRQKVPATSGFAPLGRHDLVVAHAPAVGPHGDGHAPADQHPVDDEQDQGAQGDRDAQGGGLSGVGMNGGNHALFNDRAGGAWLIKIDESGLT